GIVRLKVGFVIHESYPCFLPAAVRRKSPRSARLMSAAPNGQKAGKEGIRYEELFSRKPTRVPSRPPAASTAHFQIGLDDACVEIAVGVPGIAAAIVAFANLVEAGHDEKVCQVAGFLQIVKQLVALCINVGADVMGDLAGLVAEADASVEDGRAHP